MVGMKKKIALGLPLCLKKHVSLWLKTLLGSANLTFENGKEVVIAYNGRGLNQAE